MTCDLIIMGAGGRMGATLAAQALHDPECRLAGVLERSGCEQLLNGFACPSGSELDTLLPELKGAVIIDFTAPAASVETVKAAARHGNPVVVGTTGLNLGQMRELEEAARLTPIFWAPNMSVGLNSLLKVLPELCRKLGLDYDVEIMEIHHNKKADSPSGTALKLGECLAEARGKRLDDVRKSGRDGIIGARDKEEMGIMALRGGDVVGDHTVYFLGRGERIEVTHRVQSRETFASGAIRAAKWLAGQKPGRLFGMPDLLV